MDDGVQAAGEPFDGFEADARVRLVEGLDRERRLELEGHVGVGLCRRPPAQQIEGGVVETAQQQLHRLETHAGVGAGRVEPGHRGPEEPPEPVVGDDAFQPVGGGRPGAGEGGGIEQSVGGQALVVRLHDEDLSITLAPEQAIFEQGREHRADAVVAGGEQGLGERLLLAEVGAGELGDDRAESVVVGLRRRRDRIADEAPGEQQPSEPPPAGASPGYS